MRRSIILGAFVMVGLVVFAVVIGETAGQAGAVAVIGVIFGVFASVPVSLAIALGYREWRGGKRHETHIHRHDNRQVVVYIQRPDGSRELVETMDARQIAAPKNGTHVEVRR